MTTGMRHACGWRLATIHACVIGMLTAATAAETKPVLEHFAIATECESLDGPRREAMRPLHPGTRRGTGDKAGNFYFNSIGISVVRVDNDMVETISGDNWWFGGLGLDEGPAVYLPMAMPYQPVAIVGVPTAGERQGCLYILSGGLIKIFRNEARDNRWWFRRVDRKGGQAPATTVGQATPIADTDMARMRHHEGRCFSWDGNIYRTDWDKGTVTCMLTFADYKDRVPSLKKHAGIQVADSMGKFEECAVTDDGTAYIHYYGVSYPVGRIFRISPDRKTVEEVVRDTDQRANNTDGPGMQTSWHCGPCGIMGHWRDVIFPQAVDSSAFRRLTPDGRIATLFQDGEWRETSGFEEKSRRLIGGKGFMHATSGMAPYVWIPYPGTELGSFPGIWRFGPVDFGKPTIQKIEEVSK
jgi:hypothetical protein